MDTGGLINRHIEQYERENGPVTRIGVMGSPFEDGDESEQEGCKKQENG
jgi:hypothetical protein